MDKKEAWWKKWLFYALGLFILAILSAGISFIIILILDWYYFPIPPHLTGRPLQKYHNSGLIGRIGWGTILVIFVVTYLITTIYWYLKMKIEGDID